MVDMPACLEASRPGVALRRLALQSQDELGVEMDDDELLEMLDKVAQKQNTSKAIVIFLGGKSESEGVFSIFSKKRKKALLLVFVVHSQLLAYFRPGRMKRTV